MVQRQTPAPQPLPSLAEGEAAALVNAAGIATAEKIKLILDRMDTIKELDSRQVSGISDLVSASTADGGCGIGCW